MNQPNKVKTRVTMGEAWRVHYDANPGLLPSDAESFEQGWNAALDSVILPEGKRLETDGLPDFEDALEEAFWNFDAWHKRKWSAPPERDAFKMTVRALFKRGLDPESRGLCAELDARRMEVQSQHKIIMDLRGQMHTLTIEQKVERCVRQAIGQVHGRENKGHDTILADAWAIIARALANGKTLDQLCAEMGVATMKEV